MTIFVVMLGIALAIFLALTVAYIIVSYQDTKRTQEQREFESTLAKERIQSEKEIAQQRIGAQWQLVADREQEQALQAYEEEISSLLLSGRLHPHHLDHEVWEVAQARTLAVLQELNPRRKAWVLQFLRQADLVNVKYPIVNLARADLSKIMMSDADLHGTMLSEADLHEAQLREVILRASDLTRADLHEAHLTGADLFEANLTEADMRKANLRDADLTGASLLRADLTDADLTGADLTGANLSDAQVSDEQLKAAKSLKDAIKPNEKIYYVVLAP